jgi:hypothetical protein
MSHYHVGEISRELRQIDGVVLDFDLAEGSLDRMLDRKASILSKDEGFSYKDMTPVQRVFLTHYWCPICKLLPLYALDLRHRNKVRCGKCRNVISFPGKGKYGKVKKKLAFLLWQERGGRDVPR